MKGIKGFQKGHTINKGKKWHKLKKDKIRDNELMSIGYKIIHYQGYIPEEDELIKDISSVKKYMYKRDKIDITKYIKKFDKYSLIPITKIY
jgi:hypothetical protein